MIYVFLANGFEEVEALAPVDMLRRAKLDVTTVGVTGKIVTGSHRIPVTADITAEELQIGADMEMIVLPGGMPGTTNLAACEKLTEALKKADQEKRGIAAICAAPSVLGDLGFLKGKKAVLVLSGGNMDVITMSSVVQHGLIQRGRIFTVSTMLPDRPGMLLKVASTIAEQNGNVIKLDHNQFVTTNRNAAVELRVTIEAYGEEHKQQIVEALAAAGFTPQIVQTQL